MGARRGLSRSTVMAAVTAIVAVGLTHFAPTGMAPAPSSPHEPALSSVASAPRAGFQSSDLVRDSAASGFYDNFKADTSLDPSLWTTSGAVATEYGPNVSTPAAGLVQPVLTFSEANGMEFSNVTGYFQVAFVQSVQSYSPPFYVSAGVNASADFGNAASLGILSADGSEGIGILGNIDPNNTGYYGINYAFPLLNHNVHSAIVKSPALNTWYGYNISVTSGGSATLAVSSGSTTLGTSPSISVGVGPFYILVFEFEGIPNAPGSDFVNWSYVAEGTLASPAASPGSSSTNFSTWWWVLVVVILVVVFLVLVRIRRKRTGRGAILHRPVPAQPETPPPPAQ